jgi:hypothetical protein
MAVRRALAIALIMMVWVAEAAEGDAKDSNPQTFTVLFENDLFGDTDQQYTNGVGSRRISNA